MVITLLTLMLIVGMLLLLIEVLIVPGIGISGILGGALIIGGVWVSYNHYGFFVATAVALLCIVVFTIACIWLSHSPMTERMRLRSTIDTHVEEDDRSQIAIGARGKAATRLNLYGKVEIDGKLFEAKANRFIEVGTNVEVSAIESKYLIIKEID